MNKRRRSVFATALFCILSLIAASVTLYALSPLHPQNISDETVLERGREYNVILTGISSYDEKGFVPVSEDFRFKGTKLYIYLNEKGFACSSYDETDGDYILGKYNSPDVEYEKYSFCGESYKSAAELEDFFEKPDPIYNFDVNMMGQYIQDSIQYDKHFSGRITMKVYRGRYVITDFYIGLEKILQLK